MSDLRVFLISGDRTGNRGGCIGRRLLMGDKFVSEENSHSGVNGYRSSRYHITQHTLQTQAMCGIFRNRVVVVMLRDFPPFKAKRVSLIYQSEGLEINASVVERSIKDYFTLNLLQV
jgi:hypothetical protein